jgi:hypothetical protein
VARLRGMNGFASILLSEYEDKRDAKLGEHHPAVLHGHHDAWDK